MTDHYKTLGIERDATSEQIRKAYRKLAQTMHPDKNGGVDEFQRLQEAYAILGDPDKRRAYDAGETVTGQHQQTDDEVARSRLAQLISSTIENASDHLDMIAQMRSGLGRGSGEVTRKIAAIQKQIEKLEKNYHRIKYSGDNVNLFLGVVDEKIRASNEQVSQLQREVRLIVVMLKMLDDYACEVEEGNGLVTSYHLGGLGGAGTSGGYTLG